MNEVLIEKLKRLNQKVQRSSSIDQALKNLIAVDLFETIEDEQQLKRFFDDRCSYLQNLAHDKNFIELQNALINTLRQMTECFSRQEANLAQQKIDDQMPENLKQQIEHNTFYVPLKLDEQYFPETPKMSLMLPQLHAWMGDKKFHYILGDQTPFSNDEFELSTLIHTGTIIRQYKAFAEILDLIAQKIGLKKTDSERYQKYRDLRQKYDDLYTELKDKVYFLPLKFHIRDFENLLALCAAIRPVRALPRSDSYRNYYWNTLMAGSNAALKLKDIKNFCDVIVTDLVEQLLKTGESVHDTKTISPQPSNGQKFQWESITIKFINGELVRITLPNQKPEEVGLNDLGLTDKKNKMRPLRKCGRLLKALAEKHGSLSRRESGDAFTEKDKEALCRLLEKFFVERKRLNLEGLPVIWDKKNHVYASKIHLMPEGEDEEEFISTTPLSPYADLESAYRDQIS